MMVVVGGKAGRLGKECNWDQNTKCLKVISYVPSFYLDEDAFKKILTSTFESLKFLSSIPGHGGIGSAAPGPSPWPSPQPSCEPPKGPGMLRWNPPNPPVQVLSTPPALATYQNSSCLFCCCSPSLWRYIWHITVCKLKVSNEMIWYIIKWLPQH